MWLHACRAYEDFKRVHNGTHAQCQTDGITFIPFVFEADGGTCGPEACKAISEIAKAKSNLTGDSESHCSNQIYQNLGFTLHSENARAILRRAAPTNFAPAVQAVYHQTTALRVAASS